LKEFNFHTETPGTNIWCRIGLTFLLFVHLKIDENTQNIKKKGKKKKRKQKAKTIAF